MESLVNAVVREVLRVVQRSTRETSGIVDSYDPETHAVKVKMQPEGYLSGWLPLRQGHAGNGYGSHMAPNINDHVSVAFHEDDRDAGTIIGAFFNDKSKPIKVDAGEYQHQTKFGSWFYFKKDGSFEVQDKAGASYKSDGNGVITITDKGGNYLKLDGASTATLHAATIVLDGDVKLGGPGASRPLSAQGTTDSRGDADSGNFLTKVMGL